MPVTHIGLTGGIGSGKSTVAGALVELGAFLVDTDAIARMLTMPGGAAIAPIASRFGAGLITPEGALDRERMRELAFSEPQARRQLEAILHPLIGQQARTQAAQARTGQPVVFDVPLLAESHHWRARVGRVLVVDCGAATQVARVASRRGWTEDAALRVMAQQAGRAQRRAIADAVIHNDGITLDQLRDEVVGLMRLWSAPRSSGAAAR